MSLDSPQPRRIAPEGFRWRVVQGLVVGLIMGGGAFSALRLPSSSATPAGSEHVVEVPSGDRSTPANVLPRSMPSLSGRLVTFTETLSDGNQSIISHDLGTGKEAVIASPLSAPSVSIAGSPWVLVNSTYSQWIATDGQRSVPLPIGTSAVALSGGTAVSYRYNFDNVAFTLTTLSGGAELNAPLSAGPYYSQTVSLDISGTMVAVASTGRGLEIYDGATYVREVAVDSDCSVEKVQFVGSELKFFGRCIQGEIFVGSADRTGKNARQTRAFPPAGVNLGYYGVATSVALSTDVAAFIDGGFASLSVYDATAKSQPKVVYASSGTLAGVAMPDSTHVIFGESVVVDGKAVRRVLELNLRTGQLVKLVPGGQQDIVRPAANLNRDPDVFGGSVAYVSEVRGLSRLVTQSLAGGSPSVLTETSTGIGSARLGNDWAMYDERQGAVKAVRRTTRAVVPVTTPIDVPFAFQTTFDVRGNEAIVSTLSSGTLYYWAGIRDLASNRSIWSTPSLSDTEGKMDGPAVDASDVGFLFSRSMYGAAFGDAQGVVLRSLTGTETFTETTLVPSSNGWLTSPNNIRGYYYSEPKICRFPCADIERFTAPPGEWEQQVSAAVAGSKLLVVQASQYSSYQNYGIAAQPNRLVVFDRLNPTAAPTVLLEANGTFSQLRADGNDVVFSLRRFIAGVDVSTIYAYSATTGKLRAVTP
jgi:hypothetical protein